MTSLITDLLIIDESRKRLQEDNLNQIQLEIPRYYNEENNKTKKELEEANKEPKRVIIIDL